MPDSGSSRISSSGSCDDRLRQLDALPHALAVGADLLVGGVHQVDRRQRARAPRRRLRFSSRPFSRTSARHPLEPGHPLVERVLLGAEADAGSRGDGLPQIGSPSTVTLPLLGLSWPVISFMNVDLPAPFGPSSPVMPGGTATRDVVQADDLPVPLRDVLGRDDGRRRALT